MPVALVLEPDDVVPGCGALCVDGTVSGTPHRLVLDTGSPSTQIADPDALIAGEVVAEDTSGGLFGEVAVERVDLPDLTVLGLTSGRRTVARLRAGGSAARSLVGLDVLGSHALLLDGPAVSLHTVAAGALDAALPLERGEHGHCFLPVTLPGGRVVRALWDTGAGITMVGRELVTSHPGLFSETGNASSIDANGTTVETEIRRIDGYRIADVPFAGHVVAVADLPEDMEFVIGVPTLRQAIWSMDLPSGRWSVRTATDSLR